MVEQLTVNKSNWSGEEITVEVDRESLSWEQFGYKFHLEKADSDLGDYYHIIGEGWDQPLGMVIDNSAYSGGMDRSGDDPIEAAVKLLCNII